MRPERSPVDLGEHLGRGQPSAVLCVRRCLALVAPQIPIAR